MLSRRMHPPRQGKKICGEEGRRYKDYCATYAASVFVIVGGSEVDGCKDWGCLSIIFEDWG